jgi:hypothetical protein
MTVTGSPAMLEAAKAELASREAKLPKRVAAGEIAAAAAERSLASWRAIIGLLEGNPTAFPPCLGSTPSEAWQPLVAAADAALNHRASKDDPRTPALRQLRSLLIRSAINAGAKLPDFNEPDAQRKAA